MLIKQLYCFSPVKSCPVFINTIKLISMRTISALGNRDSCLGPVFRPFMNSDQFRLCLIDVTTFS